MALVAAEQIFIIIFTVFSLSSSLSSATPTSACQFNFRDGNKLYNYTLSSPIRNFPHGILSEDGSSLSLSDLHSLCQFILLFDQF
jgi:hypothetical protein